MVLIEDHSYYNIITKLNNELYKIDTWLQAFKLTININKTHYMVFHRARLKPTKDVMIRQNKIAFTKSTKFIGIIIDDKLKWTEHINYVKNNKISKSSGILFKVRNYLDKKYIYIGRFITKNKSTILYPAIYMRKER